MEKQEYLLFKIARYQPKKLGKLVLIRHVGSIKIISLISRKTSLI